LPGNGDYHGRSLQQKNAQKSPKHKKSAHY